MLTKVGPPGLPTAAKRVAIAQRILWPRRATCDARLTACCPPLCWSAWARSSAPTRQPLEPCTTCWSFSLRSLSLFLVDNGSDCGTTVPDCFRFRYCLALRFSAFSKRLTSPARELRCPALRIVNTRTLLLQRTPLSQQRKPKNKAFLAWGLPPPPPPFLSCPLVLGQQGGGIIP